jgi:hypothetical protein
MATDSCSKSAALLHEQLVRVGRQLRSLECAQEQRLQPFVEALDSLDSDQVAALHDLAAMLERLTASLDKTTPD